MNQINAWGKLNQQGQSHPLTAHMLDVAACFCAISEVDSVRRALARAAGRPLTEIDLTRLAVLVFFHDVGKANAGFQAKWWGHTEQALPHGWPAPAGHTHEALFIFGDAKLLGELPAEEMSTWGAACWSLWRASISHHGRPVVESSGVAVEIWRPVTQAGQVVYDPQATLRKIGQCTKQWFAKAFQDGPPLPQSPEFSHLFAGLVQFADWLGSGTRFFPYAEPGEDRINGCGSVPDRRSKKWALTTAAWRQALRFPRACGDSSSLPASRGFSYRFSVYS